mmetsp:Transcript_11793/g.22486  ORF Transcript_11793/g.22486 Transcript_11793/m.22486 type:complete len:181 (+) Transcript_11793:301-843(+)
MDGGREFWHSGEGGFIADEGPSTSRGDSCEPDETRLSRGGALGARERARDRRCCACSSANTDASFLEAFGVWVCRSCKRSPGFDLVPKAKAKQMYLLTNAELAELGCITRPNPMNKQWTSMSLYLKSQVEALAHNKHGGRLGLEEEHGKCVEVRDGRPHHFGAKAFGSHSCAALPKTVVP